MLIIKHLIIILKISFVCYSFSGTELGPFLKKIKSDHNDWHTGHKNIWVKMLGKEYHVRNEPTYLNQANAKAYCKSQGGILFEPKSAQVNKNVAKFAKDTIGNWKFWIWLGIHYTNGQFVYESDDKSIVWNNWKSTQPNGDGNCVALETINYKWGDVGCNETWYIYEICERGKSTLLMQIKDKPLKPTNSPSRDSQIDTHEDDLLQYLRYFENNYINNYSNNYYDNYINNYSNNYWIN